MVGKEMNEVKTATEANNQKISTIEKQQEVFSEDLTEIKDLVKTVKEEQGTFTQGQDDIKEIIKVLILAQKILTDKYEKDNKREHGGR